MDSYLSYRFFLSESNRRGRNLNPVSRSYSLKGELLSTRLTVPKMSDGVS